VSYQEQTTTDQTFASTVDKRLVTASIAETLAGMPAVSSFYDLLQKAGMQRKLQDGEWITVFAPVNNAARHEPEGDDLAAFLNRHLNQGAKTAADLRRAGKLRMKDGSEVPVEVKGADIRVGAARIVTPDVECTNGVIHVIDQPLSA